MKFFLGLVVGIVIALLIGAGAVALAIGDIGGVADIHIGDRDKSADVSKTYDLKDFDKIDIAGVYELNVTVGGDYSVEISGAQSEMDRVEATVSNGELTLDQKDHDINWRHDHNGLTATITMPALSGVDVSGVVDGDIKGVAADDFKAGISGVGELDLEGSCAHLDARVSGVGHLEAGGLKCKDVEVSVSGVGEASVYASDSVSARVSGMGDINVSGSPAKVDKSGGLFSSIHVK